MKKRWEKALGRSIPGFDLHENLMKCKNLLVGFGGHSMAVGVSVEDDNFNEFKKQIVNLAKKAKISELIPVLEIDEIVSIDEITKKDIEDLSLLEPYGAANKMPIFALKKLRIDSIRSLSEGKHLKLTLKSDKNNYINAIGFNMGSLVQDFKIGDRVDLAGNLEINSFNGVESIQINLKDIIKSF